MISASDRLGKLLKFVFIILILGVIVIAVTPLNLYYDQVKSHFKPVQLTGISGSVVKGSADSLTYLSAPMGKTEWFLYPKSFNGIGGRVRVYKEHFDLTFDINKLTSEVQTFHGVIGFLDWQFIKPYLQMRFGQLSGYAQFNLNQIEYDKTNGFDRIEGEITLQDFKMTHPSQVDLGIVTLTFSTQSKGMVVGNFTSQSNVLNVSGALIIQPHRWQLNLDIIPKAGHFEVDAVFNSVGDARRGGGRRLNLAGFY